MKAIMTPAKPEAVTKFNLECNGTKIGTIEQVEGGKYHVAIKSSGSEGIILYQGHGETPDLAIQQLLDRHERYATAQLQRISELRKLLLSDEV